MGICIGFSKDSVGRNGNAFEIRQKNGERDQLDIEYISENSKSISEFYEVTDQIIGRGGFGEVRLAIHLVTKEKRAVKIISVKKCPIKSQHKILKEVNILKKLDHPNIVKLYEYFIEENFILIVMEYVQGGELFDRLAQEHKLSEYTAAGIFKQILSAVNYLHMNNLVHRDLKPENIVLSGDRVKLIDFGTTTQLSASKHLKSRLGTIYYIAPEVLNQDYNEKCDVWSCGVILYILLIGFPPFNGENDQEIYKEVLKAKVDFRIHEFRNISVYAKNLIKSMLNIDPKMRISTSAALKSEWLLYTNSTDPSDELPYNNAALENIKTFSLKTKMQRAIYYFIINHLTCQADRNDLDKAFKALDLNQDGVISKHEIIIGLKKANLYLSAKEVNALMSRIDQNNDNTINYTEFIGAAIDRQKVLSEEMIVKCFKMFDKDKSGKISISEFKAILHEKNAGADNAWENMIQEIDKNGDGEIEFNEFRDILNKVV
jgi:calcium-dependent protein kinase